jgi:hypothetical protein
VFDLSLSGSLGMVLPSLVVGGVVWYMDMLHTHTEDARIMLFFSEATIQYDGSEKRLALNCLALHSFRGGVCFIDPTIDSC